MHHKRLYGTAMVGTKGQIVIPADAREELGIQTGDRLYVIGSPDSGFVGFIKEERLEAFVDRLNINLEQARNGRSHTKANKE